MLIWTDNYYSKSAVLHTSWSQDNQRVLNKQAAFNAMWNDYEPSIRVMSFPNVDKHLMEQYRVTDTTDSVFGVEKCDFNFKTVYRYKIA